MIQPKFKKGKPKYKNCGSTGFLNSVIRGARQMFEHSNIFLFCAFYEHMCLCLCQNVCKSKARMILQTGVNLTSMINYYRNVSRSNFYAGKIFMIVDIRVYSFVFLFSRNTKLAEIGHDFRFRRVSITSQN